MSHHQNCTCPRHMRGSAERLSAPRQRHDNTRQHSNNDAYIKRVMTLFVAGWFLIGVIGATISSLT